MINVFDNNTELKYVETEPHTRVYHFPDGKQITIRLINKIVYLSNDREELYTKDGRLYVINNTWHFIECHH